MSDQVIPDGTYTVMGPGGQLTMPGGMGVVVLPPGGGSTQQWAVAFGSGTYTLQNVATSLYLGTTATPTRRPCRSREPASPSAGSFRPAPMTIRTPTS